MKTAEIIAQGLYFGESPRWHEGRLWFSDFYDHAVKSMTEDGTVRIEHQLDDQPSGLGWMPDGSLLVVSMRALSVLRLNAGVFVVHADLARYAKHRCNDMVVDSVGRAWVGNFGFDLDREIRQRDVEDVLADHPTTNLVRIDPDGSVHRAAAGMHFPNGTAITADGSTLIIAETLGFRLTAFDLGTDGALTNRRLWAHMGTRAPDGICLDANGNVWVANALAPECVLVAEGGEIIDTVTTSQHCFACALGGKKGDDLYLVTAPSSDEETASAHRSGRIERARIGAL
jgi:sugar lactone lactonase YvrE